jgi:hypothetical protein
MRRVGNSDAKYADIVSYKEGQGHRKSSAGLKLALLFIKCYCVSLEQEKGLGTRMTGLPLSKSKAEQKFHAAVMLLFYILRKIIITKVQNFSKM